MVVVYLLRVLDNHGEKLAGAWHFGSLLLLTILFVFEASWWTEHFVSRAWGLAVAVSTPGLMALLVRRFIEWPAWPVPAHPDIYQRVPDALASALAPVRAAGLLGRIDIERVWQTIDEARGLPVVVGRLPDDPEP